MHLADSGCLPACLPSCTVVPLPAAAHAIFEAAKSRVYRLKQPSAAAAAAQQRKRKASSSAAAAAAAGGEEGSAAAAAPPAAAAAAPVIEAVLEVMPKWELLREVMAEIQQERQVLQVQLLRHLR